MSLKVLQEILKKNHCLSLKIFQQFQGFFRGISPKISRFFDQENPLWKPKNQ